MSEDLMELEYRRVTGTAEGHPDWRELFDSMAFQYEADADAERVSDFGRFLRAYYLTRSEPGHISRTSFHQEVGLPVSSGWESWRTSRQS